jgi:tetratricopeptide (TPR) repeat protein/uncharacterized membrane protein YqaE (UPF0057 family)
MNHKTRNVTSIIIFLAVLAVYIVSLNPVFHANDSPETTACAFTLGIQHPPGYPLFSLMGKIFTFIPCGNIGFRVNLLAACCGAGSAALLFVIIFNILAKKDSDIYPVIFSALAASLTFAFSYTIWSESLSSKGGIYTLNVLLLLVIIYYLFEWERLGGMKYFYAACFIFGVSLANHWESMAVVFPALAVFAFLVFKKNGFYGKKFLPRFLIACAATVPGIFLYIYLIIRSRSGTILNWGAPVDFQQLLWVVFRAQYADLEKAKSMATVLKQAVRVSGHIFNGLTIPGFFLAIAGIFGFMQTGRKQRLILFGVMFAMIVVSISFYLNLKDEMMWIMDVFLIPAYVSMAVFAGCGIYMISVYAGSRKKIFLYPAAALFMTVPVLQYALNRAETDQSRYFYGYDFGMNVIKSINTDGIAMLEGDFNVMPQMYFRQVMHRGNFSPVTTIFLYVPWGLDNLKRETPDIKITARKEDNLTSKISNLMALNYRERDIYSSIFRKTLEDFYPDGNKMFVPDGMAMKLSFDRLKTLRQAEANLRVLSYRNVISDRLYLDNSTEFCLSNYSSAFVETGNAFKDLNLDSEAVHYLEKAVTIATAPTKAEALTHLGVEYSKLGRYQDSLRVYEEAIKVKPGIIEAYSNMGGVYNTLQQYDKSIEICMQGIRHDPGFAEIYNNLGIAYYYKGDKKKSVEFIGKAVAMNPSNAMARKNLEVIQKEIK